jgi:hypothetical protein
VCTSPFFIDSSEDTRDEAHDTASVASEAVMRGREAARIATGASLMAKVVLFDEGRRG